ncbi:MAG: GIY-YIG nuclease family protein [Candidatus Saccharibacteria bacterium]|nr:GIY-YIG nuclease family protein [Candidatus Saccharibacteria bacterium]
MSKQIIDNERPDIKPTIYVYDTPGVNDEYLKIGYTSKGSDGVKQRIWNQSHTVGMANKTRILYQCSAVKDNGVSFRDTDVHRILRRLGKRQLDEGQDKNEWFECTLGDVKAAIGELVTGKTISLERNQTFRPRPEQERAIAKTIQYYQSAKEQDPTTKPKFLWNAKMRFGKTFASYELAKKMDMKRILILTFKPAVESAWQEDLESHVDFTGWEFISVKKADSLNMKIDQMYERTFKGKPIVVFGSFQDFLGTTPNGGIKPKHKFINSEDWDLVIFDEYHFGAWRDNAKKLFAKQDEESEDATDFDAEKYSEYEAGNAINESFLQIETKHYLFLSGTPFRAINSGEFIEEQIFNWTYSDEQYEKENWGKNNDRSLFDATPPAPNPYSSLPQMCMLTYKLPEEIRKVAEQGEFNEFDLNVFFSAKSETKKPEDAQFIYKDEVQKWLNLIRGNYDVVSDLKQGDKKPPMPYSHGPLLRTLNHTLWFLPNVNSCYAMANLLAEPQNTFYHDYKINVCAGTKAGIGLAALAPVQASMHDPLNSKTITLSCGKLTTGVTVKPWTGVFMLRNLKSPETYFQTAFRVQSPWTMKDDEGRDVIMKEVCYVFDFALDRALRQISEYSCKLNVDEPNPEKKVGEFIHFLPVLAYDGSAMKQISAGEILDMAMSGTSATLLARRWESALLVNVDNDTLRRIISDPRAYEAIMSIEGFRALGDNSIETVINKSESIKKAKAENVEKTPAEKKILDEEEKKNKSLRKQIQEKLIKFATRIPIFMYLTDYRERTLKEIITELEPELFKKVTGINVSDFELLCQIGVFNAPLMNEAVYNFKRYEDSSLSYTGINLHTEETQIGGFDETITRQEFYNRPETNINIADALPTTEVNGGTEKVAETVKTTSKINDIANPNPETGAIDITIGTRVAHPIFGEGAVTSLDEEKGRIWVDFRAGHKMFNYPDAFEQGYLNL